MARWSAQDGSLCVSQLNCHWIAYFELKADRLHPRDYPSKPWLQKHRLILTSKQGDNISYIPCLRVALTEVAWDRFCVPRAQRSRETSAVPPSNKACDDFIILFLFSKCFLAINPSFCTDWPELWLFAAIQIYPPFFRGWHKIQRLILCHPLAYYRETSRCLS